MDLRDAGHNLRVGPEWCRSGRPEAAAQEPLEGNADAIRNGMGYSAPAARTATAWTRVASARPTSRRSGPRAAPTTASSTRSGAACPTPRCPPSAPRIAGRRIWQMLAYLRTLAAPAPTDPPRGNAENGEKIFRAQCAELPSRQRTPAAASGPTCRASASRASRDVIVRAHSRRGSRTSAPATSR